MLVRGRVCGWVQWGGVTWAQQSHHVVFGVHEINETVVEQHQGVWVVDLCQQSVAAVALKVLTLTG